MGQEGQQAGVGGEPGTNRGLCAWRRGLFLCGVVRKVFTQGKTLCLCFEIEARERSLAPCPARCLHGAVVILRDSIYRVWMEWQLS